jgi:hypothetical protein
MFDSMDAAMAGILSYESFLDDFNKQWEAPIQEMALAMADEQALQQWFSMPPEAHEAVRKADPTKYAAAKDMIERIQRDHSNRAPGAPAIPQPSRIPNLPGASVIPAPAGPVVPAPIMPTEGGKNVT